MVLKELASMVRIRARTPIASIISMRVKPLGARRWEEGILEFGPSPALEARPLPDREGQESEKRRNLESRA
jgi:hypothetical protein